MMYEQTQTEIENSVIVLGLAYASLLIGVIAWIA